jgi:lipopolysaccharide/colanic/teichoic acid biosynthesis glycosyltransferase
MRTRLPTSRAALKIRFSILDVICAVVAPLLALFIRDAYILTYNGAATVALYCIVWVAFSLISFQAFHLYDGLAYHFSVHDTLDVVKAVVLAETMTCLVFFTISRLEGIPRTAPIIHALILTTGLICIRAIAQAFHNGVNATKSQNPVARENIIMIGATQVSALYIKLLEAYSTGDRRVIAMLDNQPQLIGRSMAGIRILAVPHQLESVIEEFIVHGIRTNRVIITDEEVLTDEELKEIQRLCGQREIKLDFMQELIGLSELPPAPIESARELNEVSAQNFEQPRYFKFRPFLDFFAALAMIILLSPLLMTAAVLVLLDVGSPVLFWQQRIGQYGRRFMLQKFRTLHAPYDWHGRPIPNRQKPSVIGQLLRQTRLDELPQLLNVLVGDMALIGPRPLLPEDQPVNPNTRLTVRPGITGWAQVNGGKFLTPEQKDQYDEHYIRNASVWFDLNIVFMTLKVLFRFGGRSDHTVAAACLVGFGKTEDQHSTSGTKQTTAHTVKASERRREVQSPAVGLTSFDGSLRVAKISDRKTRNPGRRHSAK